MVFKKKKEQNILYSETNKQRARDGNEIVRKMMLRKYCASRMELDRLVYPVKSINSTLLTIEVSSTR